MNNKKKDAVWFISAADRANPMLLLAAWGNTNTTRSNKKEISHKQTGIESMEGGLIQKSNLQDQTTKGRPI